MKKLLAAAGIAAVIVGAFAAPASATVSAIPKSWGLDRIDQSSNTLDNSYIYPDSAGSGVRVYVLDTGVQGDLPGFGGRVEAGFDATTTYGGSGNTDCHGHGTHVAGTIGSSEYGVAPKATIVPVRVATCRGGVSSAWIEKGLQWILDTHPSGAPGVINMSVATRYSVSMNDLTDKLFRSGLVVVAASGNYNMDACKLSPGSTKSILTVGSVNINSYKTNRTTYGDCIDLYAPGGTIVSEHPTLDTKVRTGTSMAAPHVAGAAALYLADHPGDSPDTFNHLVVRYATEGAIENLSDGVNKILNIQFINDRSGTSSTTLPAPEPVEEVQDEPASEAPAIADAVTGLYAMGGSRTMTLVWEAPANIDSVKLDHYRVEFSYDNGRLWRAQARVAPGDTRVELRKPPRGRVVSYRIFAVTDAGMSESSNKLTIRVR